MGRRDLRGQRDTDQIISLERERQAVALRLGGMDYQRIAEVVGYADHSGARRAVRRAMERKVDEVRADAEELRALQVERLERLLSAVWPVAMQGDVRANEQAARLVDRIIDLLGLDTLPNRPEGIPMEILSRRIAELSGELGIPVPEHLRLVLPSAA